MARPKRKPERIFSIVPHRMSIPLSATDFLVIDSLSHSRSINSPSETSEFFDATGLTFAIGFVRAIRAIGDAITALVLGDALAPGAGTGASEFSVLARLIRSQINVGGRKRTQAKKKVETKRLKQTNHGKETRTKPTDNELENK